MNAALQSLPPPLARCSPPVAAVRLRGSDTNALPTSNFKADGTPPAERCAVRTQPRRP